MTAMRENPDGTWSEAEPVAYEPGPDVEVYADGTWELYDGPLRIAHGRSRSRIWRAITIWRAKRRYGGAR